MKLIQFFVFAFVVPRGSTRGLTQAGCACASYAQQPRRCSFWAVSVASRLTKLHPQPRFYPFSAVSLALHLRPFLCYSHISIYFLWVHSWNVSAQQRCNIKLLSFIKYLRQQILWMVSSKLPEGVCLLSVVNYANKLTRAAKTVLYYQLSLRERALPRIRLSASSTPPSREI
jgi:hypothetical protein